MVDIKFDILKNSSLDSKGQKEGKETASDRIEGLPEGSLKEAINLREAIREHLKRQSKRMEENIKKVKR